MVLSEMQKKIVCTREPRSVVISSAGSGKTLVLTERIKYLLEKGYDPTKIVAITYTNAAAAEIRERVGNPRGLYIGTVHSYANYLLVSAGYHTGVLLDEERYDELFSMVTENLDCIQEVEYLLLDEAQDSNGTQFNFLFEQVRPHQFMVIGDGRQCIYRFMDSDPQLLFGLARRRDVKVFLLNENYRCGFNILSFAKRLLVKNGPDYVDNSFAMSEEDGLVIEKPYTRQSVTTYAKLFQPKGSTFIICRTNSQLELVRSWLEEGKFDFQVIRKAEFKSTHELKEALQTPSIKLMTIHSSKGLEADYVIVIGALFYNEEERCIAYVAATRARKGLLWLKGVKPSANKKVVKSWE